MAQEEKYLDPIEETAAPAVTGEGTAETPEAFDAEVRAEKDQPAEGQEHTRKPDTRPEGYVTKGERDRLAAELHQTRQERALYEDRFNKVVERFFKQAEPEQPQPVDDTPDENSDPVGTVGWTKAQLLELKKAVQPFIEQRQHEQQSAEEQRQFQDTLNRASARLEKVVQTRPEIGELYGNVRLAAAKAYSAQGVPDHQLKDMVDKYEADVIKWARQEYIPIEDALEQVAARFGLQTPPAKPADPATEQKRDPATGQFVSEAERASRIATSQERNASLGSAPGAPVKKMTGTELAKMDEADMWRHFDSMKGQKGSKNFDRDMGFRS